MLVVVVISVVRTLEVVGEPLILLITTNKVKENRPLNLGIGS